MHDHKDYPSLLYSIKVVRYLSLVPVTHNLGISMVLVEICWISYSGSKSVPMFMAFHVIASLGVRVWEYD